MTSQAQPLSFESLSQIAAQITSKIAPYAPTIGVILGSGLGGLGDAIEGPVVMEYKDIQGFPTSTVPGHKGRLIIGKLASKHIICMQGRFHPYEGYPTWQVTAPVRIMHLMGVKTLIVTNASGGLNEGYSVGDLMLIKDHLNLPGISGGLNPLIGPNEPRFGPRFFPTSKIYDKELRSLFQQSAEELGFGKYMREGVYVFVAGPSFETIAEARMLKMLGADAVGMSTVPEVIVAAHCNMRVLGVSLVTNAVVTCYESTELANHEEVLETARQRGDDMVKMVCRFLEKI